MGGSLNKFGKNDSGSVSLVTLIGPTLVPAEDEAFITSFGATSKDAGEDAEFLLEISSDGFSSDVRQRSELEIPDGGPVQRVFDDSSGIRVKGGSSFRVRAKHGVAAKMTAELQGRTKHNDISD